MELLDSIAKRALVGPIDFVSELSRPLPSRVICRLLGVEPDQLLRDVVDLIAAFFGQSRPTLDLCRSVQSGLFSLRDKFREIVLERQGGNGDDLISRVVNAKPPIPSGVDPADYLAAQCIVLLFGGEETTRNLIGNALYCLVNNPAQLALLRNRPEMMDAAIQEVLRFEPPGQFVSRAVIAPTTLGGQSLKPGQSVLLVLAAANRDPENIASPDEFDIERHPFNNLSFGYGSHACIGASVAKLELRFALSGILERFSQVHLEDEVRWIQNLNFRGLESLKLRCEIRGKSG